MATAICRVLSRRGLKVAPFKAQNMSNNSYACADGGEIGRAQAVQAEACGIPPQTDMNPVLLKPYASTGSQVVVNGKVWKNLSAAEYFEYTGTLRQQAVAAFHRLSQQFDYIVMEGAGSIAELNLLSRDFVNLWMADAANAKVLLVADIDRGGVFASVLGTLDLLSPQQRQRVQSFAINRFRGDVSLFEEGVRILEQRSGKRCLGVFPLLEDCAIQQEDSVALEEAVSDPEARIAIIRLPRISNFTDFRLLRAAWIRRPVERDFDWVILPGTKNTVGDLLWLREVGLEAWIRQQASTGAHVLGVCGGYQMLGRTIEDPHGMEGQPGQRVEGLGFLPVDTVLEATKTVRAVRARRLGMEFGAYEIHLGQTRAYAPLEPFAWIHPDVAEGAVCGRVLGTYLHGALEHRALAESLFGAGSICERAEAAYDRLADWFERWADMRLFEERYL